MKDEEFSENSDYGERVAGIKIIRIEGIKLKGVSKKFTGDAADRFEQERVMWSDQHDGVPKKISETVEGVWYGIWNDGVYSVAKKHNEVSASDLEEIIIPSGKYATFSTEFGGYAGEELPKLRDQIFGGWLSNSSYKQVGNYEVEVYHLYPKDEKHRRHYEIWVPIQ